MQINPSEISELIKSKIQNLQVAAEKRTEGTVISVTDGICRIHGLADVMQGEMLEFPGNTFGLALNLERDSVGSVVLGTYEHISEGDTVKATPTRERVIALDCRFQVIPPSLVRRIVPSSPTAVPVLASVKTTAQSVLVVPLDCAFQVAPPSDDMTNPVAPLVELPPAKTTPGLPGSTARVES